MLIDIACSSQLYIGNKTSKKTQGIVMINFDDKRNFYRTLLNTEVIVTIIDDETNSQLMVVCRDLSATGIAVEMEYPLALKTHVRVKVASANKNLPSLIVFGKVVRVEVESQECYLIGVTIEDID